MLGFALILFAACFISCFIGVGIVLRWLYRRNVMDIPSARGNHHTPTPRGGGLAVCLTFAVGALSVFYYYDVSVLFIVVTCFSLLLAFVSFLDDLYGLPAWPRLLSQLVTVSCGTWLLYTSSDLLILDGLLPVELEAFFVVIAWMWFINLYNFMDGIDGITGSQSVAIAIGILLASVLAGLNKDLWMFATILLAVSLGFLLWNLPPAKVFIGDVGSVPLGYIFGFLLLFIAQHGYLTIALILPAYYLLDSTYTLLKRIFTGKPIFQAHSDHFYQQAVRTGQSHSSVVVRLSLLNGFFIVLSLISLYFSDYSLLFLLAAYGAAVLVIKTSFSTHKI